MKTETSDAGLGRDTKPGSESGVRFPSPPGAYIPQFAGWVQGDLVVALTLVRSPDGPRWEVTMMAKWSAPDDSTCRKVLQDFALDGAQECDPATTKDGVLLARSFALALEGASRVG